MFSLDSDFNGFSMFTDKEHIEIYKRTLINYGFVSNDEYLFSIFHFIRLIDNDKNYKFYKIAAMLLLAEYGTSEDSIKKYFLENGFIIENTEEDCIDLKMEDNKLLGYDEVESWIEMNESVLKGKWKVKDYKKFEEFYLKKNNIY